MDYTCLLSLFFFLFACPKLQCFTFTVFDMIFLINSLLVVCASIFPNSTNSEGILQYHPQPSAWNTALVFCYLFWCDCYR